MGQNFGQLCSNFTIGMKQILNTEEGRRYFIWAFQSQKQSSIFQYRLLFIFYDEHPSCRFVTFSPLYSRPSCCHCLAICRCECAQGLRRILMKIKVCGPSTGLAWPDLNCFDKGGGCGVRGWGHWHQNWSRGGDCENNREKHSSNGECPSFTRRSACMYKSIMCNPGATEELFLRFSIYNWKDNGQFESHQIFSSQFVPHPWICQ